MTIAQVTQLTHCVDAALIARLFARFRGRYGNLWTSRATCDDDWEFIMEDWFQELSKFTVEQVRAAVNKTLSEFTKFPPTLGELVELCMKESGAPEPHEVIRLMVARDFSHPLVKMIYEKVGSWTLTNGKSDDIERKVKEHYTSAKSDFYVDPQKSWAALESFNSKPKELPAPEKKPSSPDSPGYLQWRKDMEAWKNYTSSEKIRVGYKEHPIYPPSEINKHNKAFDKKTYDEYKKYLLSVPEELVITLPRSYAYDRMRLLSSLDAHRLVKNNNPVPEHQNVEKASQSYSNELKRPFKSWLGD